MAAAATLTLSHETIATLKLTTMLAGATNAATVVNALAGKTTKSHEEAVLYNAAVGLLQYQFASVLKQAADDAENRR